MLRIAVTDQGTGISPEEQARLFHVFTQAGGSKNRKYGDKGQGLIISKRLAILMNGDIGMISEEGQGSTFWVTVKFKKCAKVLAAPMTENVSKNVDAEPMIERLYLGSHILVVEDESANRMLLKILLESAGLVVDAAQDGTKAVASVQERSYAAIFMDMQMPRLNGVEEAQEIRLLPGYRDTPIIAMTANAFAEDKAQWVAAGITDVLIKPFSPDQLFSILLRALTRHDR
jgi:CheY-like chemotaxis protein